MSTQLNSEEKIFVEHAGIVFEQTGLPRMAGRIFGWLLIADSPYQSSDQLSGALMASKGSISTMTRLLIQAGLIERLGISGVRQTNYCIRQDVWQNLIKHGIEEEIEMFRQLAESGLESLTAKTKQSRQWLQEMKNIYSFLEKEFPLLMVQWERKQDKKKK